ncbi:hypothetical protein J6590_036085 [Homalodisca vitripennis]|nr:hypothetical protein J6590_036085 [Homalodisca vitripennis]
MRWLDGMSTQVRQRITLVHGRVRSSESILRSFRLDPSRYEHAESADLSLSSPPPTTTRVSP